MWDWCVILKDNEGARADVLKAQAYISRGSALNGHSSHIEMAHALLRLGLLIGLALAVLAKTADVDFLHKQKRIFELLYFVQQTDLIDAEFYDVGRNYDIQSNIDMYKDKDIVQEFLYWYKQGMLPRNAIFSPYYTSHVDETKMLFRVLYNAKDFQTFYKTACWARLNMNGGVFTSAFTVAVFYRPDCKYMRLPAIYEIYPNMFYDNAVIQEAHRIKMTRGLKATTTGMDSMETYAILANYTSDYARFGEDTEYELSYFTEDASLNAFYYYFRQVFPFWLDSKDYPIPKEGRGALYYFIHQQLMARYYLERMSTNLEDIEDFDWTDDLYLGYYSAQVYSNGMPMPQRSEAAKVPYYKYKYIREIELLEQRLLDAIDSGFVIDNTGKQISIYTPEGLNMLGNMIEGNVDSCNYKFYGMYDSLARDILGFDFKFGGRDKVIPGALQCYSTSMRDPAFYRIYKRIMTYFFRYKKNMPVYKQSELMFPGVKIESVSIDKLMTYFQQCESLINNAVFVENFQAGMNLKIKARKNCLNYKPFTYKLNVDSDKDTKAVMRIFIGPDFEGAFEGDYTYLMKYYKYFVELDKFIVNLRSGKNVIERRSSDSSLTMPDMTPSDVFYKKLQKAISGSEPLQYYEKIFGFPERLTLPKGSEQGIRFKIFFYLSQLDESKFMEVELPVFGKMMLDGKPLGFPLDRPMYPWKFFVPNMYFKDVLVYHMKDQSVIGQQ